MEHWIDLIPYVIPIVAVAAAFGAVVMSRKLPNEDEPEPKFDEWLKRFDRGREAQHTPPAPLPNQYARPSSRPMADLLAERMVDRPKKIYLGKVVSVDMRFAATQSDLIERSMQQAVKALLKQQESYCEMFLISGAMPRDLALGRSQMHVEYRYSGGSCELVYSQTVRFL